MKWLKDFTNGHMYRTPSCTEYRIDDTHTALIICRDDTFDSYVMEKKPGEPLGSPFMYMFGTPVGSMPYHRIVEMTIVNAPDYYHLCEEGY